MQWTEQRMQDDGSIERRFDLDGIPGVLWTPAGAREEAPVPLVVMGHPGGLDALLPRLEPRARQTVGVGFAAATIELPGKGARPPIEGVDAAVAELRAAIGAGERPSGDVVDRLILPLVERAAPEWQRLIDALLELPEIGGPVAISGGVTAVGVRLARAEPRIVAAGLFAGSYLPRSIIEEAREVSIPIHVLLQWDDAGNDREAALELFDALGSREKTLNANLGGHTGVPAHAGEDAARFFERHLSGSS